MKGRRIEWFTDELSWIAERKDWPNADIHAAFVARFDRPDVSLDNLKRLRIRKGWTSGHDGRFHKGQAAPNKGKKMPFHPNSAATRFKKGQRPANKHDIGHESIDRAGYVKICVSQPNPWTGAPTHMAFKHRWLWERANGPVPHGHALKCVDGDKTNTDPANWVAIPLAMLPRLAGRSDLGRPGYDSAEPEVKPVLMAIATVEHRSREIRKRRNG